MQVRFQLSAVIGEDFISDASVTVTVLGSDIDTDVCRSIPTMADMVVEGIEVFTVSVVSIDSPIGTLSVNPDVQLAAIIDNSSGFDHVDRTRIIVIM